MSFTDTFREETSALYTDLYQLTMLQAYFREEMNEEAVFDLFVRRLGARNYLLAAGLEQVLAYLESLSFSEQAIDYLAEQEVFDDDFLQWLSEFAFTGEVYAVPEGTPVFADEPILEVVAPIGEAQFVETLLLNQITHQTGIASKAARVRHAADARAGDAQRIVADFGMRRLHGTDAAVKGARAMYVAGIDATSNVAAGEAYGIPITGTMAHSYVEAHDSEMDAFRAFADTYPETILLVDTYDTIEGVKKVIDLAEEKGDDFRVRGIRLDSGDLADLATRARRLLNDAGLDDVLIFASSGLDEWKIADLVDRGAPIDGFGVGTRMGTMADQPYLDSAYKLAGYAGKPRMKLSKEKSNLPGRKQVVRQFEGGTAVRDVIAQHDEAIDGTPLLEHVMEDGQRTEAGQPRELAAIRDYAETQRQRLPERLRAIDAQVPVILSSGYGAERLLDRLDDLRETDVLVVGFGGAGGCSAVAAHEAGEALPDAVAVAEEVVRPQPRRVAQAAEGVEGADLLQAAADAAAAELADELIRPELLARLDAAVGGLGRLAAQAHHAVVAHAAGAGSVMRPRSLRFGRPATTPTGARACRRFGTNSAMRRWR